MSNLQIAELVSALHSIGEAARAAAMRGDDEGDSSGWVSNHINGALWMVQGGTRVAVRKGEFAKLKAALHSIADAARRAASNPDLADSDASCEEYEAINNALIIARRMTASASRTLN